MQNTPMANTIIRFSRLISTVLITLILLFCYINLPESISYSFNANGGPIAFAPKQSFFYTAATIIFFVNILILFLKNAILKLDFSVIFPKLLWPTNLAELRLLLSAWFDCILAVINFYLIFVILGISNINSGKNQNLDFNYNYLLMVGALILLFTFFYLPFRLLFTNPKVSE